MDLSESALAVMAGSLRLCATSDESLRLCEQLRLCATSDESLRLCEQRLRLCDRV